MVPVPSVGPKVIEVIALVLFHKALVIATAPPLVFKSFRLKIHATLFLLVLAYSKISIIPTPKVFP